jgi:hypothetical protein
MAPAAHRENSRLNRLRIFCLAVRSTTVRHEEMSSGLEKQVAACPMRICIQSPAANGKAFFKCRVAAG